MSLYITYVCLFSHKVNCVVSLYQLLSAQAVVVRELNKESFTGILRRSGNYEL
jgi:hypothetical protein